MNKMRISVHMSVDATNEERAAVLGPIRDLLAGAVQMDMQCDSPTTTFIVKDWHKDGISVPITKQGAAVTPLEVKVDAKDALAALDAVEIALVVLNAPHSSSDAIDKANEVLLAAMTPLLKLDTTCEASK